ncbi:uncharacterized protein LTR77_006310 [Saxophila tyrrhenica]|uniref:Uncharacterized protein n=1 Tax=Saxophila tyrrhenica TaxID=1690608 RepID=A0AAV9P7S4_9PEZI|nr:hypothetical protein LTR77_006310 [Saxophila tyrrhenica]
MEDEVSGEPLFRANKRRKVFRKRADPQDDSEGAANDEAAAVTISNQTPEVEEPSTGAIRSQRRPINRKHGIGFTSTKGRNGSRKDGNEEMAVVLANAPEAQDVPGSDRFVKPTGKVAVAEDKHMMAYIDSKLADARSPTPPVNGIHGASSLGSVATEGTAGFAPGATGSATSPVQADGDRTLEPAAARSYRVYQRPTRRRPKPSRDQADIARDSMIDQIMQESSVPLYDRPNAAATAADMDEMDNDAAAAEAYKAQLLAEMEAHKRRPPKTVAKDAKAPTGPKLGGSRAQRERMKALEEAKGGGGVKK